MINREFYKKRAGHVERAAKISLREQNKLISFRKASIGTSSARTFRQTSRNRSLPAFESDGPLTEMAYHWGS